MHVLDWTMIGAYFALMVIIGWWSHNRISDVKDFYTAGGRMPWWLAGISHHMSGYSAVMFVAFASVAYTTGITVYFEDLPEIQGRQKLVVEFAGGGGSLDVFASSLHVE